MNFCTNHIEEGVPKNNSKFFLVHLKCVSTRIPCKIKAIIKSKYVVSNVEIIWKGSLYEPTWTILSYEYSSAWIKLFCGFVDILKAFGVFHRRVVAYKLLKSGVGSKFISIIIMFIHLFAFLCGLMEINQTLLMTIFV